MGRSSITTEVEVWVDDVLSELSDDDLREELRSRGREAPEEGTGNWQHMRGVRRILNSKEPPTAEEWAELKYLLTTYVLPEK